MDFFSVGKFCIALTAVLGVNFLAMAGKSSCFSNKKGSDEISPPHCGCSDKLCCCNARSALCSVEEKCCHLAKDGLCKPIPGATLFSGAGKLHIHANIDVGFGNYLTIRGRGAGLSWNRGIPLKNEGTNRWSWSAFSLEGIEFKLLLNDGKWEIGCNHTCCGGATLEITPKF